MKRTDKIMRAIAFYFALALFCVLLPIVLSYALGYQIDYHNLKIYKTGILYIESRPAGAAIYLNGNKHPDVTPSQVEELKPGRYKVVVKREGFYPWEKDLEVRPNMVTKADSIVLFPVAQEMKKMGERGVLDFVVSDNGYLYYMKKSGLYRSTMDGSSMKRLSSFTGWPDRIIGKKFSPSGDKFLYFNDRKVWVVDLEHGRTAPRAVPGPAGPASLTASGGPVAEPEEAGVQEVFSGQDAITDVFWYPGAGYIIIVTDKGIEVAELRSRSESAAGSAVPALAHNVVSLYKFNSQPQGLYYDETSSALYFTDTGLGKDFSESRYLYRIDLRKKFFDTLMQVLLMKEPDSGYEKRKIP